jgi:hypothetical protein
MRWSVAAAVLAVVLPTGRRRCGCRVAAADRDHGEVALGGLRTQPRFVRVSSGKPTAPRKVAPSSCSGRA